MKCQPSKTIDYAYKKPRVTCKVCKKKWYYDREPPECIDNIMEKYGF
jgi:hypothetical protein